MKLKCLIFLLITCISSTVIFYAKEYYFFKDDVKKQDLIVLETIKTLKKLLIFTANDIKENASIEEIQKSLSIHFGYNLILDNDLLLNSSRLFVIKDGKLLSSLGIKSEINNQLNFAEALSKKYGSRTILYSDPLSEDGSIYLLYTAQGSPNTFTFHFPLTVLSNVKIQHLEKTGLNAFKLPPLTETNRFLSEEFVSENEFFHNELNFWKTINKGCINIFLIFLAQALIFLSYLLLIKIANFKKSQLLDTFFKLLETNTEEETIKKNIKP